MLHRRLLVLLLAALTVPALALEPDRELFQYVHRRWTLDDGLPQSTVNALLQDRDGYLWTATFGGLARFDGVRFRVFDVAGQPDLGGDRFLSLVEMPDGTLWAGTDGRGLVRLDDGRPELFTPPDGIPLGSVRCLAVAPDGALWMGTGSGVGRLGADGSWRRYGMADGLPGPRALALLAEADGTVWVGTDAGVARWTGQRFEVPDLPAVGTRFVFSLLRGAGGELWIGSGHGEVFRWQGDEVRGVEVPGGERVRALLQGRDGELWIGADPGGLYRLTGGRLDRFPAAPARPLDQVLTLLEDQEGNLWAGSSRNGLHQLRSGVAVPFGGPDRSPDHPLWQPVLPILDDGAGGVWAGLACGGVVHLERDGRATRYGAEAGLDNTCVWALAADGAGGLWVGTLGGGLYRLRDGRAQWQRGPPSRQRGVRSLLALPGGLLFAGTDDGLFRVQEGGAEPWFSALPGTAGLQVFHLAVAPDGALWLGSDDGVRVLPPAVARGGEGGGPERLHPDLDGVSVRAIHFDAAGAVWLGTYGRGLLRWHDGTLTGFSVSEGLPDDVVSFIAEDHRGHLWLTGNRGVTRVERRDLESVARGEQRRVEPLLFTADDGMPVSETNGGGQPAGLLTAEGLLWVPTIAGLARFDTRSAPRGGRPPPVRLEEVRLDGARLDAGAALDLPSGARNLEIRYTALSFDDPERLSFRYRLEGWDDAWTEAGTRRVAYYPFLPAGEHRFQVQARNADGIWSRPGADLSFTVAPHFVQTPLAWLLGLLVLAALVLGTAVLRRRLLDTRRRLEHANRHLERLATIDELTGIANRRSLMAALEREWKRAVRYRRNLGLLMIDLDHFKLYNDRYGHLAGDDCLRRVAEVLDGGLRRAEDVLARFGGEELAAVVPEATEESMRALADTLRRRVEEEGIPHAASPDGPVVTVSIGGAVMKPTLADTPDDLLSAADRALYAAKAAGRNRVAMRAPRGVTA